jgi:peptidoglycan/xylan/chitin deacetylase (PgdA/CDA1 family)
MISLHCDTKDLYRTYGITHFIQKYGISLNTNTESEINLIYGDSAKNIDGFSIQIVENEMQNDVSGYLKTENEEKKIPLFEKPIRLDEKGKTLVMYVDEDSEYPCVVSKDHTVTIGFDIFNEVGHIQTGYLEHFWKSKSEDSKGNQLAGIPVVDYYEKILFDCLSLASNRSKIQLKYKPFWPDGMNFAVCLTHDVDRVHKSYQYFTHFFKYLKRRDFRTAINQIASVAKKMYGNEPYWNFDRIMEIERRLGVRSTFFFLNEQRKARLFSPRKWKLYWGRYDIKDQKIVETIKRLDAEGWEIGVHGSYNSYSDKKLLEEEKTVLEGILGKKVYGISQHYCNLKVPETWEYHEKIGLAYDSTTGFVTDIGFRCGTCHPFHPFNSTEGKTLSVWELPIIIMDNACAYKSWKDITNVVNIVERCNGLLLLRWHQAVFNEQEFPGRSKIYERIIFLTKMLY